MEQSSTKRRSKSRYCGRLNIAGVNIKKYREAQNPRCSQNDLSNKLQLEGLNVSKQMVQQVESGEQCITDVELMVFAKVLRVSISDLLDRTFYNNVDVIDPPVTEYSKSSDGYGTRSVAED